MKSSFIFWLNTVAIIMLAYGLYGCTSKYYMPTLQNVPDLKQKGDLAATAVYCNTSGKKNDDGATGFEFQAAYAITNHLAVTGGGTKIFLEENKGHMFDAGLGYFNSFSKTSRFSYGIYATGSLGRVFPEDYFYYLQDSVYDMQRIDYDLKRFFIQPVINFDYDVIRVSASARLVQLDIAVSDEIVKKMEDEACFDPEQGEYPDYVGANRFYFLEPAFTFRLGWEKVKLHFQAAYAIELQEETVPHNYINLNAGLSFRLPLKKAAKPADF